jgi:hypothetical protein
MKLQIAEIKWHFALNIFFVSGLLHTQSVKSQPLTWSISEHQLLQRQVDSSQQEGPKAGLQFKNSTEFNVGTFKTLSLTLSGTTYSGSCLGPMYLRWPQPITNHYTYTEEESDRAKFISRTTSPALGLRVLIRNITVGMQQNPLPYINLKYEKLPMSKSFNVEIGRIHNDRYLALATGSNHFFYEIARNKNVVESGFFDAEISHKTESLTRHSDLTSDFMNTDKDKDEHCKNEYNKK